MTSTSSILDMLKQKTQRQAEDNSSFDITIGQHDEQTGLAYSSFIDFLLSSIKKQRPDIRVLFPKWGKIQLLPFHLFHPDGDQYKLGTSDLILLGDKLHINVIIPSYLTSGSSDSSSYDTILHLSKLKELKLEIKLGQEFTKKIHIPKLSYENAIELADILVRDFISPKFPYPQNAFFKPMDFYSFVKELTAKSFGAHAIQLNTDSWQFKAYPTARLLQKLLTLDFLGGDITYNRLSASRAIVEYEPVLINPRARVLATKSKDPQRIPYKPESIIAIQRMIGDEFLDRSPILDDSTDLIQLENIILERTTAPQSSIAAIDSRLRARMLACLFFEPNEI